MFRAIDVNAIKRYKSPKDPDTNNPTVFLLGQIDPALLDYINNKCVNVESSGANKSEKRKISMNTMQHSMMVIEYGLRGIENWYDKDGLQPVQIVMGKHNINGKSYEAFPKDLIPMLGNDLIEELTEKILNFQEISEEEEKN